MSAPVRAFLAVYPPARIRVRLAGAVEDLEIPSADIRRIPEPNIHLTVRFLGSTPPETVERLKAVMDRISRGLQPIPLKISGVSAFPARRPTVIAADLRASDRLSALAEDLEAVARDLGFDPVERPFRPHLTVARIKRGRSRLKGFSAPLEAEFTADELILFKSVLKRSGAEYVRLHTIRADE